MTLAKHPVKIFVPRSVPGSRPLSGISALLQQSFPGGFMHIVIVGVSNLGLATAHSLVSTDHSVIITERARECLGKVSDDLHCGLIHGDGTCPDILFEASSRSSDWLNPEVAHLPDASSE